MKFKRDLDEWRAYLGSHGVSGRMQTTLIGELSEGQQCRLIYAMICMQKPNMLLLDEPTNHLDLECIDSLADAINAYNGGVVLVSHDFRLIDQVAEQIWVCEDKGVDCGTKTSARTRSTSRSRLSAKRPPRKFKRLTREVRERRGRRRKRKRDGNGVNSP